MNPFAVVILCHNLPHDIPLRRLYFCCHSYPKRRSFHQLLERNFFHTLKRSRRCNMSPSGDLVRSKRVQSTWKLRAKSHDVHPRRVAIVPAMRPSNKY